MRIAYVLEDAGTSGGAKVVLEHCNRLAARGHEVTLFTVTYNSPHRWFPVGDIEIKHTGSYGQLEARLSDYEGLKVATWWKTAPIVAGSGGRGFYLIQDIESSYATDETEKAEILSTYRLPLTPITESRWVADRVEGANYIGIGIDHTAFREIDCERDRATVLYSYRKHFLKDPELFMLAAKLLPKSIRVIAVGYTSPPLPRAECLGYVTDSELMGLYNRVGVYLSTSVHEGFCLPCLEAMACGCPVVTTDADGNMEYCFNEVNCLVVPRSPEQVAAAVTRLCTDSRLADRLSREGLVTARRYQWDAVIDKLEIVLEQAHSEEEQ